MWLKESNRLAHLKYGAYSSFIGTILFATGLAVGMEFKDREYGNKFDWLDIAATEIGAIIGQTFQTGLIYLIYNLWKYII